MAAEFTLRAQKILSGATDCYSYRDITPQLLDVVSLYSMDTALKMCNVVNDITREQVDEIDDGPIRIGIFIMFLIKRPDEIPDYFYDDCVEYMKLVIQNSNFYCRWTRNYTPIEGEDLGLLDIMLPKKLCTVNDAVKVCNIMCIATDIDYVKDRYSIVGRHGVPLMQLIEYAHYYLSAVRGQDVSKGLQLSYYSETLHKKLYNIDVHINPFVNEYMKLYKKAIEFRTQSLQQEQ